MCVHWSGSLSAGQKCTLHLFLIGLVLFLRPGVFGSVPWRRRAAFLLLVLLVLLVLLLLLVFLLLLFLLLLAAVYVRVLNDYRRGGEREAGSVLEKTYPQNYRDIKHRTFTQVWKLFFFK